MDAETIRTMAAEKRWDEVKRYAPSLLDSLTGDDLARVHLYLSVAWFETTRNANDWSRCVKHAELGCAISDTDGWVRTWAYQRLAVTYVNSKRYAEAEAYCEKFFASVDKYENLRQFTPYVETAMSHVAYGRGDYASAIEWRLQALTTANLCLSNRLHLNLVWAYAKHGNTTEAALHLSACEYSDSHPLKAGARALLCGLNGNWKGAIANGRIALASKRVGYDFGDASDVCLLMVRAAIELGLYTSAFAFIRTSFAMVSVQASHAHPVNTFFVGGGEYPDATAYGSGGYHPDCRFSTGIA